jgi:hypothetical protein
LRYFYEVLSEVVIKLVLVDVTAKRQGFFLRILWCSQSGEHPEKRLGQIGQIWLWKVEEKESFYILGYLLELIIKICLFQKQSLQWAN